MSVSSSRLVHHHGGVSSPSPGLSIVMGLCYVGSPTGRALWDFPVHGGHIAVWYPAVPASLLILMLLAKHHPEQPYVTAVAGKHGDGETG